MTLLQTTDCSTAPSTTHTTYGEAHPLHTDINYGFMTNGESVWSYSSLQVKLYNYQIKLFCLMQPHV